MQKTIELAALDGSNGLNIFNFPEYRGRDLSVSNVGDFNGDGIDDIAFGKASSNQSYVIFGSDEVTAVNVSFSELNGSNGIIINGIDENDQSGFEISHAGDINDDGVDDLIIGAPFADGPHFSQAAAGRSYVIFGSTTWDSVNLNLADLNGSNGFEITSPYPFGAHGWSVAGAGDLNGDNVSDLIIGAPNSNANGEDSGAVVIVFGAANWTNASINTGPSPRDTHLQLNLGEAYADSGYSVSSAGDFNGDGLDDVIIGAPGEGKGYVIFGSSQGASIEPTDKFEFFGGNRTGYSVSDAGDFNGDGIDDVIFGSRVRGAGENYVVFGSSDRVAQILNLDELDGLNGFKIVGINSGDQLGTSASSLKDVNGDGIDDVIVGAYGAGANWGESYVLFGAENWSSPVLSLSSLDSTTGYRISGFDPGTKSGARLSSAGDFNNDGVNDIIVGTSKEGVNGTSSPDAYILFGKSDQNLSVPDFTSPTLSAFSINDKEFSEGDVINASITATDASGITYALIEYTPDVGDFGDDLDMEDLDGDGIFTFSETINNIVPYGSYVEPIDDFTHEDYVFSNENTVAEGTYIANAVKLWDAAFNSSEYYKDGSIYLNGDLQISKHSFDISSLDFDVVSDGISETTPAFDIVLTSESDGVATFAIYADASTDPDNDGTGSFEFTLSHDPLDMLIDASSYTSGAGYSGVPNYNATTGVLQKAAFALPNVTDASIPFATFDATILNEEAPVSLTITNVLVDTDPYDDVTESFDFSTVEVESIVIGRGAETLSEVRVSYDFVTPSGQQQTIELPAQATSKVSHAMARNSDMIISADKPIDEASEDAIGAYDALQALRLAVGLTKSDGTAEWHDYLAADINKDGRVGADDALDILKFAVGLTDGSSADWIFVDGDADWSGIDRRNTDYDEGIMLEDVLVDTSISMTGILVGDLDGSYAA